MIGGVGLGPYDQLAPESVQHVEAQVPEFPFTMISVPAWWAIIRPNGAVSHLVEGGLLNPTAGLAASYRSTGNRRQLARGWTVRPATATEIEGQPA